MVEKSELIRLVADGIATTLKALESNQSDANFLRGKINAYREVLKMLGAVDVGVSVSPKFAEPIGFVKKELQFAEADGR